MTRITQSDVARAAGVHNTTVSLALRDSPNIPEATRKRIKAVAEELGYRPDPALQALVAYRHSRVGNRRQGTLAYVTNSESKYGWRDDPAELSYHAGAAQKAAEAGFHLEHFWLGEHSPRRLSSMLFHRGITGVIFASDCGDSDRAADFEFERVSAVAIGCFRTSPPLHRVVSDFGTAMRRDIRQARDCGYRRIGLVMPKARDDRADQVWSTTFLVEQSRVPASERIPVLHYGSALRAAERGAIPGLIFQDWFDRNRPDVVFAFTPPPPAARETFGAEPPGWINLGLQPTDDGQTGVRENCLRVGELAADFVVNQMLRNIRGVPTIPTTTLVECSWVVGESVPSRSPFSAWQPAQSPATAYTNALVMTGP